MTKFELKHCRLDSKKRIAAIVNNGMMREENQEHD